MEIEIITAKKKLTKSLVSQMMQIKFNELDNVRVLGFVIGVVKNKERVLILEVSRCEYRVAYCNWRMWDESMLPRNKNRYVNVGCDSVRDCKKYYEQMELFKDMAIQIYM